MKYANNYYKKAVLITPQRVKRKNHIPTWVSIFSRAMGLAIALCAMIMLSGCVSDTEMMNKCQQTHSFETCAATLN